MSDIYNLEDIGEKVRTIISTMGIFLIRMKVLTTHLRDKQSVTAADIKEILVNDNGIISEGINIIRSYVRMHHNLHKDYKSLSYPWLEVFQLSPAYYDHSSNYDESGAFGLYFSDTVKNVLHMPQEQRDCISTLFVHHDYESTLNSLKESVSPDTLVITSIGMKDIQLPFIPSVHRIQTRTHIKEYIAPILLDHYLDTLTELTISGGICCEYYLTLIEKCRNLESIFVSLPSNFTNPKCDTISVDLMSITSVESVHPIEMMTASLSNRRRMDAYVPIKALRLHITDDNVQSIALLMEEISHHPLEVLVIDLSNDQKISVVEHIIDLVCKLDKLETLSIQQIAMDVVELMGRLDGKIDKLSSLSLSVRNDRLVYTDGRFDPINKLVLKMENIKEFAMRVDGHFSDWDNSKEVDLHLARNIRRDTDMVSRCSMLDILPNVGYTTEKFSGIIAVQAKSNRLCEIVTSLYNDDIVTYSIGEDTNIEARRYCHDITKNDLDSHHYHNEESQ